MNSIKKILFSILIIYSTYVSAEEPLSITQSLWEDVKVLKGIPSVVGFKNTELYVFFDPNCYVCAELFDLSKNEQQSERALNVKAHAINIIGNLPPSMWIPINQMKDSSRDMSIALLRSGSFNDIEKNYTEFDFDKLIGSTKEIVPTDSEITLLAKSKNIWKRLGGGTPLFVFRDKNGNFKKFTGIPPLAQLHRIIDSISIRDK